MPGCLNCCWKKDTDSFPPIVAPHTALMVDAPRTDNFIGLFRCSLERLQKLLFSATAIIPELGSERRCGQWMEFSCEIFSPSQCPFIMQPRSEPIKRLQRASAHVCESGLLLGNSRRMSLFIVLMTVYFKRRWERKKVALGFLLHFMRF